MMLASNKNINMNPKLSTNMHKQHRKLSPVCSKSLQSSFSIRSSAQKCTSINITLSNKKRVELHNYQYISPTKEQPYKQKYIPEFWGCIIPKHLKSIQKQRLNQVKVQRSKTEGNSTNSSPCKATKGVQASEILLTHYLKRKYRSNQRQFYFTQDTQEDEQGYDQDYEQQNWKSKKKALNIVLNSYRDYEDPLQRYFEIQQKAKKMKKQQQTESKIKRLNQSIKFRKRILYTIQTGLDQIKKSLSMRN